jgi:hypothetical protein
MKRPVTIKGPRRDLAGGGGGGERGGRMGLRGTLVQGEEEGKS